MEVFGSESIASSRHLGLVQPLPVDAHVHLHELVFAVDQRGDDAREVPRDHVISEEDPTCSRVNTSLEMDQGSWG